MAQKLPSVDALFVGFGWTAAIVGQELAEAGLNVLALERGDWRDTPTDFATTFDQDELRYMYRHDLFINTKHDTLTIRNAPSETALPMRRLGSFLPGTGVGGSGVVRAASGASSRTRRTAIMKGRSIATRTSRDGGVSAGACRSRRSRVSARPRRPRAPTESRCAVGSRGTIEAGIGATSTTSAIPCLIHVAW